MTVINMKLKTCTRCGETKPLSDFGKHSITKDGLNHWCRACNAKRGRVWRGTPAGIFTTIKARNAYYNDHPFKISKEDFIEWYEKTPKICVYCDAPEEISIPFYKKYGAQADRLSIDCSDNSMGYVKGNLTLACHRCNGIKSDFFSYDEMLEIGQRFVKPKWVELGENYE